MLEVAESQAAVKVKKHRLECDTKFYPTFHLRNFLFLELHE